MSLSDNEEALFDDIYDDDQVKEETNTATTTTDPITEDKVDDTKTEEEPSEEKKESNSESPATEEASNDITSASNTTKNDNNNENSTQSQNPPTTAQSISAQSETGRKADLSGERGKMFIGGLDWDTDEDRLKEYFSQYGEVVEHTIMREASTGRSRGFGFLTFADKKSVQEVLKTQHVLDGKVIDPKRSIPREEQDKTGKIFVGGIAPEVRPHEYEAFFSQFGTIIDAQLMLDKDTGKSRGFGFVTYDSAEAVDRVCKDKYLDFNGKQIEVKKAEPRGPQQQQNHLAAQQQRYLQQGYGQRSQNRNNQGGNFPNAGFAGAGAGDASAVQPNYYGVTPEAMNEYYKNMQQYWATLQQQGGQAAQFAQYAQQLQMQQQQQPGQAGTVPDSVPPPPPQQQGTPPINAPRGPRGGGYRGGRHGRGRGGYSRNNGGFHPYQR